MDFSKSMVVAASGHDAIDRFLNFFATQIENDNTRAAYLRAAREFLAWCDDEKLRLLADIQPVHVAAWIKQSKLSHSIPTAKLRLAAIRHRSSRSSSAGETRHRAAP